MCKHSSITVAVEYANYPGEWFYFCEPCWDKEAEQINENRWVWPYVVDINNMCSDCKEYIAEVSIEYDANHEWNRKLCICCWRRLEREIERHNWVRPFVTDISG